MKNYFMKESLLVNLKNQMDINEIMGYHGEVPM